MSPRLTLASVGVTAAAILAFTMAMTPAAGAATTPAGPPGSNPASSFDVNNLTPITDICKDSKLTTHTGFQIAPACASTEFGEVSSADKNPSLLIVQAPNQVRSGESFTLAVSSKNIIRDRFLAAGAGGYYAEGAVLDPATGLTHGHFHVACRVLGSTRVAGQPDGVPAFFKAVEDGQGSAVADTVTIAVPGKNAAGGATFPKGANVQCSAWAGDGSHRVPLMQRANETPAFDSVRIAVRGGNNPNNRSDGRRNGSRDD